MRPDDAHAAGLSVRNLECRRAGRKVFSGLSFEVRPGDVMQVRGANGSGKSSLLRLLCGLLPPSHGEVRWLDGAVVSGNTAGDLAYMGHACGMNADLTVLENLRSALHIAGVTCSEHACREVLARMGLAGREDDEVRHLSQGQRRRLALSRVQLSGRPVWLLDEPLADLDAAGEQELAQCLSLHAGQGGLAVVTTHRDIGSPCRCTQSLDLDGFGYARRVELDH